MTMNELNQLRNLQREIQIDNERLAELETRATHITQVLHGMPSGDSDGNKLEREVAAIVDLRTSIESKQMRCIKEQIRLERYIADISDSIIRQIFTLRFIECRTWQQVANAVGNNTADNMRKTVLRFLKKCP